MSGKNTIFSIKLQWCQGVLKNLPWIFISPKWKPYLYNRYVCLQKVRPLRNPKGRNREQQRNKQTDRQTREKVSRQAKEGGRYAGQTAYQRDVVTPYSAEANFDLLINLPIGYWYFLLTPIPGMITGSHGGPMIAVFNYITLTTPPKLLPLRFLVCDVFISIGE